MGAAVGMFVGFTPTLGFQTIIAVAIAAALRVNKAAPIVFVWVTNVFTAIPIYALCHRVGVGLMAAFGKPVVATADKALIAPIEKAHSGGFAQLLSLQWWMDTAAVLTRIGKEMWVGCLLVAFIVGTITYFVCRWSVGHYRQRREQRRNALTARRAARPFTKRVRAREPLV